MTKTRNSLPATGFWGRHGWKILLGLVVVVGLFGIGDLLNAMDADPAITVGISGLTPDEIRATNIEVAGLIDWQVRSGGLHLIVMSLVWIVILVIPFRRGERWAWFVMWAFPVWSLAVSASFLFIELQPDVAIPPPAISGWIFFALTGLILLLSRGAFTRTSTVSTRQA
jgi:hypothetical protein